MTFSSWSCPSLHHPETFPQRNSSNHENNSMKFPLNTFSVQITICQMSFEIYTSFSLNISFRWRTFCQTLQLIVTKHCSYQSLFTKYQLLVTSHQLLIISYQSLVASYQSLVASHQLLVACFKFLVTRNWSIFNSYQSLVTNHYLLLLAADCQSLVSVTRR